MNKAVGVLPCDFPEVWFPAQLYFLRSRQTTKNKAAIHSEKMSCHLSCLKFRTSLSSTFTIKVLKGNIQSKASEKPQYVVDFFNYHCQNSVDAKSLWPITNFLFVVILHTIWLFFSAASMYYVHASRKIWANYLTIFQNSWLLFSHLQLAKWFRLIETVSEKLYQKHVVLSL